MNQVVPLSATDVTDAKRYFNGTHRARAPRETLRLIRPLCATAGITRLADITGLDRIGIPTFSAIRPNAQTLAVASGKGVTEDAARVSALMEGIELFHAETAALPQIHVSIADLTDAAAACCVRDLPLWRNAVVNPTSPMSWTSGRDLLHAGQDAYVPTDLVLLNARRGVDSFVRSSNGLASGCILSEATLAALYELIERDAITCHHVLARRRGGAMPRVGLETIRNMPMVAELLYRFEQAQVQPIVYDFSVDTHVPVYFAHIYDRTARNFGMFYGSGAHLDPEIALLRALTEAAQSRLVILAGNRDDFGGRQLKLLQVQDTESLIAELESQPACVSLADVESRATPTFQGDLTVVLDSLASIGVQHAIVVDLTLPEFAEVVSVVRVVVPGLEGQDLPNTNRSGHAQRFVDGIAA